MKNFFLIRGYHFVRLCSFVAPLSVLYANTQQINTREATKLTNNILKGKIWQFGHDTTTNIPKAGRLYKVTENYAWLSSLEKLRQNITLHLQVVGLGF